MVGGGVQVGVSFVQYTIDNPFPDVEFFYIVSEQIYNSLSSKYRNANLLKLSTSPARIINGHNSRQILKRTEKQFNPDVIYSVGFPSYVKFKKPEIGRYTNPWGINLGYLPWHLIVGKINKILFRMSIIYRHMWAKNAFIIETQTDAAKKGVVARLGFNPANVIVIPNTVNKIFLDNVKTNKSDDLNSLNFDIFCLSADYPHKNLEIIPLVAYNLKFKYGIKFKFILTLPKDGELWASISAEAKILSVIDSIENVGVLKLKDCITFYKKCRVVFLPTLLEVFSATYIEAIVMGKPIVTTDLDFAKDVCQDCALYFKHTNSEDAAEKLYELFANKKLYNKIVENCGAKTKILTTHDHKYQMVYNMLKKVVDGYYARL